jgi:DNA-binding IclR family transcriptional regulator
LGISEIGRRLDMSKGTAVRLAQALTEEAFLVQNAGSRCYRLGPEAFAIGIAAEPSYSIQRLAAPIVRSLALETGDWACFSIRQGFEVVCLSVEKGNAHLPPATLRIGDRYPLGVSSAGLAVLAALPDDEARQALEIHGEYIDRTYPHCSVDVIRRLVAETRRQGYSVIPGILLPGYWALGVPLLQSDGCPIAAITIVSSEMRLGTTRRIVVGERMRRASCELMDAVEKHMA